MELLDNMKEEEMEANRPNSGGNQNQNKKWSFDDYLEMDRGIVMMKRIKE